MLNFLAYYWSAMDIPSMDTKSRGKIGLTTQDDWIKLFLWASVFLTEQFISSALRLFLDTPVFLYELYKNLVG